MIDVDGAEAGADVAGEEDSVEDEERDEEQVEGRLHLRRAEAGVGGLVDGWAISLLGSLSPPAYFRYFTELPAAPIYKAQADLP